MGKKEIALAMAISLLILGVRGQAPQGHGQAQPATGQLQPPPGQAIVAPPVHDPVIIRQDSTYYVFCTGRGARRLVIATEPGPLDVCRPPVFRHTPGLDDGRDSRFHRPLLGAGYQLLQRQILSILCRLRLWQEHVLYRSRRQQNPRSTFTPILKWEDQR